MSDEPQKKDRKPLTPAQIERNRRAGLIRSKQRTSEDYRKMSNKRWEKERKGDDKNE